MATISLDQLREDVDKKYGDFEVDLDGENSCRLRNALRLNKEERAQLRSMQKKFDAVSKEQDKPEEDADGNPTEGRRTDSELEEAMNTVLFEQIRLLAENKASANKLLKAIGDDQAMLLYVIEQYMGHTQLGESEPG